MSYFCGSFIQNFLNTGTVPQITSVYLAYNGQIVQELNTVTTSVQYNSSLTAYVVQVNATDSTNASYTFNQAIIIGGSTKIAYITYSSSYSKNSSQTLSISFQLVINDYPPITQITSQFSASGDFAQLFANGLVNGATVPTPNFFGVYDTNYQAIYTQTASPVVNCTGGNCYVTYTLNCPVCSGEGYAVMGSISGGEFIWYADVYLTSLPFSVAFQYVIPYNQNC